MHEDTVLSQVWQTTRNVVSTVFKQFCFQELLILQAGESGGCSTGVSLVGRMRGLRQDVQRKISQLRASGPNPPPPAPAPALADGSERRGEVFPSTSSVESLPSGSGSSEYPYFLHQVV